MNKEMADFVKTLRLAADFFEARPELGVPSGGTYFAYYGAVNGISIDTKPGLAEFVRLVGGRIDKTGDDSLLTFTAQKEGFRVCAVATRNGVCERVVVGTKIEPEHIVPAQDEQLIPEREVEIVEWHCPSILAIAAGSEAR